MPNIKNKRMDFDTEKWDQRKDGMAERNEVKVTIR